MATLSTISTSVIDRFKKNENTLSTAFTYNDSGTLEGKGGCWYTDKNTLGDNADVPVPGNDYVVFQIGMRNKGDRTQFYCDGNNFSKRHVDNTSDGAFSEWVQQNKAVLTDSYRSGYSWYRKYSDGFIEQGGRVTETATNLADKLYTFNLTTPFTTTTYYCQAIFVQTKSTGNWGAGGPAIVTKNTSTAVVCPDGINTSHPISGFDWYACGY